MHGLFKRAPLTPAEIEERKKAAAASVEARRNRHQAETTPSIKQGSSGAPSRSAVALFRQGQARPDTRARRGAWDTRTPEAPIGAINATATFHFPKTYRGNPDRPRLGPRSMVMAMARAQKAGLQHQDMVVQNPKVLAEAYRHPQMRQILEDTAAVLRGHQKATIERGIEKKLIPHGTHPAIAAQAYKHASLKALHKLGLVDYHHRMDDEAKRTLKPLVPFMFFAHRRVFDHLNQARLKGKWAPFRDEFGSLYRQKKHGKLTGHERMRMRPMGDFIKQVPRIGGCTVDLGDGRYEVLPPEQLEKIDFGQNPRTQLARAMRPRMRRNRLRLRLNTQKHIRRLTNGGVTRQERWMLFGKQAPLAKGVILGAAGLYGGMKAGRFISRAFRHHKVRAAASDLYREDLGNAIKQHLHVLRGGTASPHVKAAADRAFRAAKLHAVQRARLARNAGLARVRPSKLAVAGTSLGAGAAGFLAGKRRPRQPPLYQSAQPDYS